MRFRTAYLVTSAAVGHLALFDYNEYVAAISLVMMLLVAFAIVGVEATVRDVLGD